MSKHELQEREEHEEHEEREEREEHEERDEREEHEDAREWRRYDERVKIATKYTQTKTKRIHLQVHFILVHHKRESHLAPRTVLRLSQWYTRWDESY